MEPFKNLINRNLVRDIAAHLHRVDKTFDAPRFQALALDGLAALELKARVHHVCNALEATLPRRFDAAAAMLEASLAPARRDDDLSALVTSARGLAGWALWPLGEFVVRRGIDDPRRALAALHAMTQRFSAEFAIRPFIAAHPDLSFATLRRWAADPSPHVRRLVSEGSRPRLPWGMRLQTLVKDPSPTLPLLLALQDDPSEYVRRSVANHLNDIAKDHPGLVVDWLTAYLPGASSERRALLRHASRTLIKQGHAPALRAWGLGQELRGTATLAIAPRKVVLGGAVSLTVRLRSTSRQAQRLAIDYRIHHVKASGGTSVKVFKGWGIELGAGEQRVLVRRHSLKPVTTRRYHGGRHVVELQVNGATAARDAFVLQLHEPAAQRHQGLPNNRP